MENVEKTTATLPASFSGQRSLNLPSAMDLPFLYQTRTILRLKPKCRFRLTAPARRQQHTSPAVAEVSFFRRKAEEVAARVREQAPNTLTRQEQAAFDSLRRLAGQRELNARLGIAPEPDRLDTDPDNILAKYTPQRQAEDTASEVDGDSDATAEAVLQEAQAAEVDHIIHQISTNELHALATAFRSALKSDTQPGDVALWEVLEANVFPLLGLLKASQRPLPHRPSQSKKTQSATKAANAALEAEKAAAEKLLPLKPLVNKYASDKAKPPSISPLQVLSRYYPAALLLALRLLTKHHPLSLQSHRLLPHLRTLGPSSYILGVTTPFYNTYLLLRWHAYSSLSEVCTLLSEMERGAVEFDQGTYRFLIDLADDRAADLAAMEQGGAARGDVRQPDWWLLPEQKRWWPTVEEWRGKVARSLEERGLGAVLREGPSNSMGDLPFKDAAPPQVWL